MTKYKLIASDMDGTLLGTDLRVSDENRKAIDALSSIGVYFVPTTGRTLSEADLAYNLDGLRYIIYSNGAVIYDKLTGQKLLACLSKEKSNQILDVLFDYDAMTVMHYNGNIYTAATDKDHSYYNVSKNVRFLLDNAGIFIDSDKFKEFAYSLDEVESICAFFHDADQYEEYKKRIAELSDICAVPTWYLNLEISNPDADKGTAVLKLARLLGISPEETMGIGDSGNDIPLIKKTGLGLAVQNGSQNLKECADEVICSNDEHAIKYILEHYFT